MVTSMKMMSTTLGKRSRGPVAHVPKSSRWVSGVFHALFPDPPVVFSLPNLSSVPTAGLLHAFEALLPSAGWSL
eukprot:5034053-Pyramimonas_sp.AAC.1